VFLFFGRTAHPRLDKNRGATIFFFRQFILMIDKFIQILLILLLGNLFMKFAKRLGTYFKGSGLTTVN